MMELIIIGAVVSILLYVFSKEKTKKSDKMPFGIRKKF